MTNELYHHGVKGMKWGVRKTRTKTGRNISVRQQKTPLLAKGLSRVSPKIRDTVNRSMNADIVYNNKKVGDLQIYRTSKDELNGVWLGVNEKQRGQGIADAVLKETINYAKENGYKYMTLEVPGNSPDARHIYEKNGFIAVKQISSSDDVWGGLTSMRKDLRT